MRSPEHARFIEDVTDYVLDTQAQSAGTTAGNGESESQTKKRKLDHGLSGASLALHSGKSPNEINAQFEVREVSFSIPQRKRLHVELSTERIQLKNPATGQYEASEDLRKYSYALRLPVPEKAQKQYNYCLIPEYGEGIGRQAANTHEIPADILLWTMSAGPPKAAQALDVNWANELAASGEQILEGALNIALKSANIELTYPDKDEFASAIPESHRKGETAFHVKAFKGSKDGKFGDAFLCAPWTRGPALSSDVLPITVIEC